MTFIRYTKALSCITVVGGWRSSCVHHVVNQSNDDLFNSNKKMHASCSVLPNQTNAGAADGLPNEYPWPDDFPAPIPAPPAPAPPALVLDQGTIYKVHCFIFY